jgi:hypothetical protein
MSKRFGSQSEQGSPQEQRLREIVDVLVQDESRKPAYLSFAHELMAAERRQPQASSHKLQDPDFSQRTKRMVMKWFERGLSGHLLWLVGRAAIQARFR